MWEPQSTLGHRHLLLKTKISSALNDRKNLSFAAEVFFKNQKQSTSEFIGG